MKEVLLWSKWEEARSPPSDPPTKALKAPPEGVRYQNTWQTSVNSVECSASRWEG